VNSDRALIFIGPPGAGKGTQARLLSSRHGFRHISTGNLLCEAVAKGTPLGRMAEPLMAHGDLIPDTIVNGLVEEKLDTYSGIRLCVFDGFPRTVPQAIALDKMVEDRGLSRPIAIEFQVESERLFLRLSGRWTCSVNGESYNLLQNPPKIPGICDCDGGRLVQRTDDQPEVVRRRIANYERETRPVCEYYRRTRSLRTLDASKRPEEVSAALERVIRSVGRAPSNSVLNRVREDKE
jgi:adenylate kinase